jgi:hypothetical protein
MFYFGIWAISSFGFYYGIWAISGIYWQPAYIAGPGLSKPKNLRPAMAFADLTAAYHQKRKAECQLGEGDYLFSRGFREITKQDMEELKADKLKEHDDETSFLEWVDMHFPQKRSLIEALVLEHPGLVTSGPQFPSEEKAWGDVKTYVNMWRDVDRHDHIKCVHWTDDTYCDLCRLKIKPSDYVVLDRMLADEKQYDDLDDALDFLIKYPHHGINSDPSLDFTDEEMEIWQMINDCNHEYNRHWKRARVERKSELKEAEKQALELEKQALVKRKAEAKAKCAKYIVLIKGKDESTKTIARLAATLNVTSLNKTIAFIDAYASLNVAAICASAEALKGHSTFDELWEAIVKLAPNEDRSIWLKLLNVILLKYHI